MDEKSGESLTIKFYEKVKEYYELKTRYETDYDKFKAPILKNADLTIKDKKEELAKIKPKCVNCHRPVGTIFDIVVEPETLERTLTAICGSRDDPCPLKIELAMGDTRPLPAFIEEEEKEMKKLRDEVIQLKNKLLMGIITNDQVLEKFDELKNDINTSNQILEFYLDIYTKIVANPSAEKKLQQTETEKFLLKEEMGSAVKKYKNTGNSTFIKDTVDIYINQLRPLIETELSEKYKECAVISKWDTMTRQLFYLIQNKHTIESLEYSFIEPRVITFRTGYSVPLRQRQQNNKTEKHNKNKSHITPLFGKTRKVGGYGNSLDMYNVANSDSVSGINGLNGVSTTSANSILKIGHNSILK